MTYTFQVADKAFKADRIRELALDSQGLRFLKLRSLSRKEHVNRLIDDHGLSIPAGKADARLRGVFESQIQDDDINTTIRQIYSEERKARSKDEAALITELYKMNAFDWGGLFQNSLERTIVDNYVKKIRYFDELQARVDDELFRSMKAYVFSSWYNHWTSIIIEDIFRDHASTLPAVSKIKKVDFFVKDIPFDLKVTFLPEGFIKEQRRQAEEKEELSLLRKFCRTSGIHYDEALPAARLLELLWAKVSDTPTAGAKSLIRDLKGRRLSILKYAQENPVSLIRWLYENQGVRRFDASNRLFLVLVDCDNFFESWKLKRAKDLLVQQIHGHLDNVDKPGYDLEFQWEGTTYSVTSDIIFVNHQRE